MIAIALACKPKLLIADEPTTALDVTIQAQILDLMAELKSTMGMAVMLITHAMGVVAEVAQRVVVMYAGKVVEEATVEELFANPRHPYTQGLIRSIPRIDLAATHKTRLEAIPGTVPKLIDPAEGCRFAGRCRHATPACSAATPGEWSRCVWDTRIRVTRSPFVAASKAFRCAASSGPGSRMATESPWPMIQLFVPRKVKGPGLPHSTRRMPGAVCSTAPGARLSFFRKGMLMGGASFSG
jgi:oligopeptide/dipeptide ABC transporter ATP-binding protein